ncbi:hypothetical protein [Prochlorococcus marinus]|uniref:hypothetical protein n=1 Tax=Prochlorococcus marinus TaxID=1219 RepID=UPI0022B557C9|nr:hypothetical protein [Prochlorococcus marinus]
MIKRIEIKKNNSLKPPSKAIVRLYSLIAILLVLIPEWLAELTLLIKDSNNNLDIPKANEIWETQADLKLSTMNIRQLRELAVSLKIHGYSGEDRNSLSRRLLNKLKSKSKRICKFQKFL